MIQRYFKVTIPGLALVWLAVVAPSGMAQSGGNPDAKKLKNPVAATPASIEAGKQLYQKYCRFCHGADAKGDGPMAPKDTHPPNLIDDEWQHGGSDGEIYTTIRDGAGPKQEMKPLKSKMTDQEMWHVVNYLRSLSPKAKSH